MPHFLTLPEVDALAVEAHAGQVDKIGVPYIEHVRAVSHGWRRPGFPRRRPVSCPASRRSAGRMNKTARRDGSRDDPHA